MNPLYVDASEFQLTIDVAAYRAAGYARIAHRASYRDGGVDARFVTRWPTFTGLVRQAYHFAYEGDHPPVAANHFCNLVESVGGFHQADEAMLDCEWFQRTDGVWVGLNPIHGADYVLEWVDVVARREPQARRLLYGNAWWFEQAGIRAVDVPNTGLITAAYATSYRTPAGWPHSCIWQFSDVETVPGFPGEPVDCNRLVCPTTLAHLTYQGDDMSAQDVADINAHTDAVLARMLGEGMDPADGRTTLRTLRSQSTLIYGPQKPDGSGPIDPTHKGVGDVMVAINALPRSVTTAVVAAVKPLLSAGVDPQLVTDVVTAAVNAAMGQLSGTFTVTP